MLNNSYIVIGIHNFPYCVRKINNQIGYINRGYYMESAAYAVIYSRVVYVVTNERGTSEVSRKHKQ